MQRAFFGTHQLKPTDFTREELNDRVTAKKEKYQDMRDAAAAGSATDHQLNLLAVVKTTGWERNAAYA